MTVFDRFGKLVALYTQIFRKIWRFVVLFNIFIGVFTLIDWLIKLDVPNEGIQIYLNGLSIS